MPKPLPAAPPARPGSLAEALRAVPDPRRPDGWRPDRPPPPPVGVLQLAVAAMLGGARSLYAVAQWGRERVADDPAALVPLGLPPGRSPSVATLHRVFKALDVAAFERALGRWLATSGVDPGDALAVDGKTLRGIHGDAVPGVHLVAASAHRAGAAPGQAPSPGKGQEPAAAEAVLAEVPLAGRPVTGDALLTQRDLCVRIVAGGATTCSRSTRTSRRRRRPWRRPFPPWAATGAGGWGPPQGPPWLVAELARLGGGLTAATGGAPKVRRGRRETRMVWALADPDLNARAGEAGEHGAPWPPLRQVCRVRRRRVHLRTGEVADEVSDAVTGLGPERADAARLLRLLRGHWGIESKLHWVRALTFDEDRRPIRAGAAPQAMAACRNLVIALVRRSGETNVAAALRPFGGRPFTAIALVASAGCQVMK